MLGKGSETIGKGTVVSFEKDSAIDAFEAKSKPTFRGQ